MLASFRTLMCGAGFGICGQDTGAVLPGCTGTLSSAGVTVTLNNESRASFLNASAISCMAFQNPLQKPLNFAFLSAASHPAGKESRLEIAPTILPRMSAIANPRISSVIDPRKLNVSKAFPAQSRIGLLGFGMSVGVGGLKSG